WYIALAAAETGHLVIVGALMLSTLLNIAYFMPIVARAWFVPRAVHPARSAGAMAAPDGGEGLKEAPLFCLIPLSLTALGCIVLFVFAGELQAFLAPMIDGLSTKGR
ncbi:MAG: monovalent cation/H+ antiporter subunit D family protein, partial [Rhodospirillaceae bacterium]|nr:monovalent cation/H+ antiporter subunit D family protein [Rhodospirillaceae bacterium]